MHKVLTFSLENQLRRNVDVVLGLDEVGVGAIAGPITAAAVALREQPFPWYAELNDSKRLSVSKRRHLFALLEQHAVVIGVGWALPVEVDRIGVMPATVMAFVRAVVRATNQLGSVVTGAVVDGAHLRRHLLPTVGLNSLFVNHADELSLSVAAASIIAKVSRDYVMGLYAHRHHGYGFERNVGYGVPMHLGALRRFGVTAIHRRSTEPVRRLL